jgi:hypothetical protein
MSPAPIAIARIQEVLADRPATEAELRALTEQAGGWARTLEGQVRAGEGRLAGLAGDPGSSLSEIATELRRLDPLRRDLAETRSLIAQLEQRARELRSSWLAQQTAR